MNARGNTPWRRIERALPLRAWRDAELAALAQIVQEPVQAWRAAWGLPAQPSPVPCPSPTASDQEPEWRLIAAGGQGAAWLALAPDFEQGLARSLCGVEAVHSPLARGVIAACRDDLPARLLAALRMTAAPGVQPEPARAASPWTGQATVDLDIGARLLLDATAVATILRGNSVALDKPAVAAARAPLTPIHGAVAGMRLPLQARLADCELEVGNLQDLCVGDIVPLRHRLDEPLQVRDASDALVFGGFLARQGPRKALELAAAPNPGAQRP